MHNSDILKKTKMKEACVVHWSYKVHVTQKNVIVRMQYAQESIADSWRIW